MQKERGLQYPRGNVDPINRPVKQVQLAGVGKSVKSKRRQAEDIKMAGFARRPAPEEDKRTDEEVEAKPQALGSFAPNQRCLGGKKPFRVKGFAIAGQTIGSKRPDAKLVNLLENTLC